MLAWMQWAMDANGAFVKPFDPVDDPKNSQYDTVNLEREMDMLEIWTPTPGAE